MTFSFVLLMGQLGELELMGKICLSDKSRILIGTDEE